MGDFEQPYVFKVDKREVVIQHQFEDKFLRIDPGDNDSPDSGGGRGKWARWIVHLEDDKTKCRLQAKETQKYLRIKAGGEEVDVAGGTGGLTLFTIHHEDANTVKLESNKFPGKFIAVGKNGNVRVGTGGRWCVLDFFREGKREDNDRGKFERAYVFRRSEREVVVQHKGGGDFDKFLRVKPDDEDQPDPDGGKGKFARWIVVIEDDDSGEEKIRLRSKKSEKYLRIKGGGDEVDVGGGTGPFTLFKVHFQGGKRNEVKLESNKFPGKYIAVGKNNVVRTGTGGPWCELRFFRD